MFSSIKYISKHAKHGWKKAKNRVDSIESKKKSTSVSAAKSKHSITSTIPSGNHNNIYIMTEEGGVKARDTSRIKPKPIAAMSFILGGTGQIYLGQKEKGSLIIIITVIGLILFIVPGIMIVILGIIDAHEMAIRLRRGETIQKWEFFWHKKDIDVWQVSDISRTHRVEESVGEEQRLIDNSRSSSPLKRTLTVSREWTQSFTMEYEKAQTTTNTKNVKVNNYITKGKTVEDFFREKSSYSLEEKRTHAEDVAIEVLPYQRVRLSLHWKNILQLGEIELKNQYGNKINIPFKVVVGLTFDQAQVDEEPVNNPV